MTEEKKFWGEESVLQEAERIINGERNEQYGKPEDCFDLIAQYWNAYFCASNKELLGEHGWDEYINTHDVAMMMTLLKIARTNGQKKRDNYVDICGYAAIASKL